MVSGPGSQMRITVSKTADPWPRRMVWTSTILLAISIPLWWVIVGYFQQAPTNSLSFSAMDGWCDPATQGVGVHCFGDFQVPRNLIETETLWTDPVISVGYTPVGLLPNVAARGLEAAGLGLRGSLIVFLVVMCLAMAIPALLTAIKGAPGARGPLPVLLFFAAAVPVLITFDRGNTVGFALPFLLLFVIYLARDPRWVAPVAAIAATAVKPQFILIVLALVAMRRMRDAALAAVGAVALIAVSFLAWPGSPIDNIRNWWGDVTTYGRTSGPDREVTNLSAVRAVWVLGDLLDGAPAFIGSLGRGIKDFAIQHPGVPGAVLLLVCVVGFVLRRGSIPRSIAVVIALALPALVPGVSYGYYLLFAVVVAVAICGPVEPSDLARGARAAGGLFADLAPGRAVHRAWAWLVVVAAGLSIAPIIVRSPDIAYTPILGSVALLWLAACLAPFAWGAYGWLARHVRAARAQRAG